MMLRYAEPLVRYRRIDQFESALPSFERPPSPKQSLGRILGLANFPQILVAYPSVKWLQTTRSWYRALLHWA
jgi:hypothetical protein